jgi:hypothetical protein
MRVGIGVPEAVAFLLLAGGLLALLLWLARGES